MGEGGYRQINKSLNICAFEEYLASQQSHLPPLPDVEQVTPRVIRVLGQNPGKFTLQGTNTYIVGTGSQRLIIDTGQGIPQWATLINSTLKDFAIHLSYVFLTHWHGDHTLGVPDLLSMYPDLAGSIYKNRPNKTQQPIEDGQVFRVEGATVRTVYTPGHSDDHICFILEEENAMFTGDNILGHGSSAVEELATYMATLRKMAAHGCVRGYPAHGVIVENLPAKISNELAQKVRREAQVLRALSTRAKDAGGMAALTVHELVSVIHGDGLDAEVKARAIEPFMEEVLRKLTEDGKVAFQVRMGVRRWFFVGD